MRTVFDLQRVWSDAAFHLIEGAGHAASESGIRDALIQATDRFGA